MILPLSSEPAMLALIDQLLARDCAFALYRLPGRLHDCLCMQLDGGIRELVSLSEPAISQAGFVIAPFAAHAAPLCFIADELEGCLPCASAFPPLSTAPLPAMLQGRAAYAQLFAGYHEAVSRDESLRKIVLARAEDVVVDAASFSLARAYLTSAQRSPHACTALLHSGVTGSWLCSSPEILLRGVSDHWESVALAGTQLVGGCWDEKNRVEQACVAEYSREVMDRAQINYIERPADTLRAGAIEHLCTRFDIEMPAARVAELVSKLHPTPAISGYPADAARSFLSAHPDLDRAYYSGYLGAYHAGISAELFVTLRCMQVSSDVARLYAGGGILAQSEEENEWQETQLKMQGMRSLLA